jgi:hypothetical protein
VIKRSFREWRSFERFKEIVNFELFRDELEKGLNFSEGLKGGRPACDAILIFKILILQTLAVPA